MNLLRQPVTALVVLAVLVTGYPVWAQPVVTTGPLQAQARAELARLTDHNPKPQYRTEMENPVIFWMGVALVAVGVVTTIASVSWERESDLSNEYAGVQLGRDLAPCGTDPAKTLQPVASCKMNSELFWVGGGVTVVGGGLMLYGGRQVQIVPPPLPGPAVRWSLRF